MRRLFVALFAGALILAVAVPAVSAAKPTHSTVDQATDTELFDALVDDACGVDLDVTISGHAITSVWSDAEGNAVRQINRFSTRFVFSNPLTGPEWTTWPPCSPAPGPMSTTQSAVRIVSSSCSTTMSVLPRSRIPRSVRMSRALSR